MTYTSRRSEPKPRPEPRPKTEVRVISDRWLIEGSVRTGRIYNPWGGGSTTIRLSEVFDRWERMGIELQRPFTVVVDTIGNTLTVEQEVV